MISRLLAPSMARLFRGDRHAHCAPKRPRARPRPRQAQPATPVRAATASQPVQTPRQFDTSVSAGRASAIMAASKKWVNGTQLTYYCFKRGDAVPAAWQGSNADIGGGRRSLRGLGQAGHRHRLPRASRRPRTRWCASASIRRTAPGPTWAATCSAVRDPLQRTMNFGWPLTTDLRPRHGAARDRPHARPGARAPEPERRHHLEPRRRCSTTSRARPTTGRSRRSSGTSCARSRRRRSRARPGIRTRSWSTSSSPG